MSATDSLLMSLLECGSADLGILDDVSYDLGEIADDLLANGIKPTLNAITDEIFRKGQYELGRKLEEAIEETERELDDAEEDTKEYEELQEKLSELEDLDIEADVDWFCNCLDTSVWFVNNEEIYRKHLADEIEEIEENMGFSF